MELLAIHWVWSAFLLLFVFIPLTLMWVYALIDIFLNSGLSVLARVVWLLVVLLIPLFGALAYFLFRPTYGGQAAYVQTVASPASANAADQLAKAEELRRSGAISDDEYNKLKASVLA